MVVDLYRVLTTTEHSPVEPFGSEGLPGDETEEVLEVVRIVHSSWPFHYASDSRVVGLEVERRFLMMLLASCSNQAEVLEEDRTFLWSL